MILVIVAGFAMLATGSYRPSLWLFGTPLPLARRLAALALGYGLLGVSLWRVLAGGDTARGLVEWVGLLTLGALIVVAALWLIGRRSDRG